MLLFVYKQGKKEYITVCLYIDYFWKDTRVDFASITQGGNPLVGYYK